MCYLFISEGLTVPEWKHVDIGFLLPQVDEHEHEDMSEVQQWPEIQIPTEVDQEDAMDTKPHGELTNRTVLSACLLDHIYLYLLLCPSGRDHAGL